MWSWLFVPLALTASTLCLPDFPPLAFGGCLQPEPQGLVLPSDLLKDLLSTVSVDTALQPCGLQSLGGTRPDPCHRPASGQPCALVSAMPATSCPCEALLSSRCGPASPRAPLTALLRREQLASCRPAGGCRRWLETPPPPAPAGVEGVEAEKGKLRQLQVTQGSLVRDLGEAPDVGSESSSWSSES